MADKENIKKLENHLESCSKEELEKVYKEVEVKIIKHISKDN